MYTLLKSRSHRIPFLISLLMGAVFLTLALPTATQAQYGSPLRLRLKLESNTLRYGQTTKVYAEFLDRDYNQVPSDGTRVVQFAIAPPGPKLTGWGQVSPPQVTVKPGEWSAPASLAPTRPGRLFITASSQGLDSSQALVLIIGQQQSFLSRMFETVAYAETENELSISPETFPSAPANNKFQVALQIGFLAVPKKQPTVRIATDPSAGIVYKNQRYEGAKDIKLDPDEAISDSIGIVSANPGKVKVSVTTLPDGANDSVVLMKDSVELTFDAPKPARLIFEDAPQSIGPHDRTIPVCVQLADDSKFPLALGADRNRTILVSSATDPQLVDVEPQTVVLEKDQRSAHVELHLKRPPAVGEMKLLAIDVGDNSIGTGDKLIIIQRLIPISALWLLTMAIMGGALGGLARQLHKGGPLDHVRPRWIGDDLDLGLSGRILGSVVSGMFLYWALKLGLGQVTLDLGTKTVAFFFGGIGGFAGLVVLDRLVDWCFKIMNWKSPTAVSPQVGSPAAATSSPSLKNA